VGIPEIRAKGNRTMKCNVGKTDKMFRIILGIVIILAGFYFKSWWGAVGVIPIVTCFVRWCLAYVLFGLSTCKEEKGK
jgi:hypothetical protein